MPTLKRPGVYVEEVINPSFVAVAPSDALACFVGAHSRGPLTPTIVQSWGQFVSLYGGFGAAGTAPSYLALSVYNFFSNGGRGAYILRVIDTTGLASAAFTLQDTGPVDTLLVTAANPGVWGNEIFVDVVAGSGSGLFSLIVRYGGTTDSHIVERWNDLSMAANTSNYAPTVVNSAVQGSRYIILTDEHSVTAAPGNNPANIAGVQLGTGSGSVPGTDGGTVSTGDLTGALPSLDLINGPLVINLPAITNVTVLGAAITYCENREDCFLVVDSASALSPASAVSFAGTLASSSFAAVYYPWVLTSDPATNAPGATRLVPPGGFVLGLIAQTDATRGTYKAPAGLQARLVSAVGLERRLGNPDLDLLNISKVNAIRQIPGAGIVVMGARTLSSVLETRYVNVRRTLIFLRARTLDLTQFAVFEPNDYVLWNHIASVLGQFLLSFWQSGGLKGSTSQEAFYVLCDSTNNTPTSVQNGEVNAEVGVALQSPAEFVVIKIGQWQGGQRASVLV